MPKRRTKYVVGFAFTEDREKVVLIRKTKPAWQYGRLNGVGGKVEPKEYPGNAMIREFQEEAGVATDFSDWRWYATLKGKDFEVACFAAFKDSIVEKAHTKTSEVVGAYRWRDLYRELLEGSISNLPWLLALATDPDMPRMQTITGYSCPDDRSGT
jgi:8-oxo-dGTP diphosphatase